MLASGTAHAEVGRALHGMLLQREPAVQRQRRDECERQSQQERAAHRHHRGRTTYASASMHASPIRGRAARLG